MDRGSLGARADPSELRATAPDPGAARSDAHPKATGARDRAAHAAAPAGAGGREREARLGRVRRARVEWTPHRPCIDRRGDGSRAARRAGARTAALLAKGARGGAPGLRPRAPPLLAPPAPAHDRAARAHRARV